MIYLVHGSDLATSRKLIINQYKKLNTQNKGEFHIADVTPDQLTSFVFSFGIFGDAPFLILDISGIGKLNISEHIDALVGTPQASTVIILSDTKLSSSHYVFKTLNPKSIESEKKLESNIFLFLDSLFQKNRKEAYKNYKNLIDEEFDPFYIFTML